MNQKEIESLSIARHHQKCLQTCQKLIQSDPENPLPWKYAGKSLLALGKPKKAQQCLLKCHQLNNTDPETAKDIGNTYLSLGKADDASEWYIKSIKIDSNYAPAISNLANLKRQSGSNKEAVNLYKQAIKADPQLIQAYIGAAKSLTALKDFDTAKLYATKALEINKDLPGANEAMGIILQQQKSTRQALIYYQNELAISPKSNTSLLNVGILLLENGNSEEAIEIFERKEDYVSLGCSDTGKCITTETLWK